MVAAIAAANVLVSRTILGKESQEDLRYNRNFNTYKGAVYENIVRDMLVK